MPYQDSSYSQNKRNMHFTKAFPKNPKKKDQKKKNLYKQDTTIDGRTEKQSVM